MRDATMCNDVPYPQAGSLKYPENTGVASASPADSGTYAISSEEIEKPSGSLPGTGTSVPHFSGICGRDAHTPRDYAITTIVNFCEDILNRLQLDLTAERRDENSVVINITGGDRGFLLSNSAAILNSLEYLINKVFSVARAKGKKEEDAPGIELDSDDYRKHRKLELELLAQMASQKVLTTRKPLTLQPMAPRERKIVHLALAETAGIESRSEGSGDNRCITIYPI